MTHITVDHLAMRAKLQEIIDQQDAARGRPLTDSERLANLTAALREHDSDCLSRKGLSCDCGAAGFWSHSR